MYLMLNRLGFSHHQKYKERFHLIKYKQSLSQDLVLINSLKCTMDDILKLKSLNSRDILFIKKISNLVFLFLFKNSF